MGMATVTPEQAAAELEAERAVLIQGEHLKGEGFTVRSNPRVPSGYVVLGTRGVPVGILYVAGVLPS